MSISRTISVDVAVDLSDFDDEDLEEELKDRGKLLAKGKYEEVLEYIPAALADHGCPDALVKAVEEWVYAPVPTPIRLEEWKRAAGL